MQAFSISRSITPTIKYHKFDKILTGTKIHRNFQLNSCICSRFHSSSFLLHITLKLRSSRRYEATFYSGDAPCTTLLPEFAEKRVKSRTELFYLLEYIKFKFLSYLIVSHEISRWIWFLSYGQNIIILYHAVIV